ncbi:MAG TPA: response regulator, partial [Thermoguttaceae bacterium]|nr:response regulator [Thermoguttaceae bacterium]
IAQPATDIAAVAQRIGTGDTKSRAADAGPFEIRRIAESLNLMVDTLSRRVRVNGVLNDIYVAASAHNRVSDLLGEVLPRIMEATRSQAGVIYLASDAGQVFQCMAAHGMPQQRIAQQFRLTPPDHLLAEAAATGSVQVFAEIPEGNDLRIVTQAGQSRPHALMAIPLMRSNKTMAVIGLASLYDYRPEDRDLGETLRLSLGPSLAACLAGETTEKQAEELRCGNEELTAANEELQSQSEELREQAEELQAQRAAVEEADRLKSEFLSNMSHELRTPLNSVMALSQLMISRGPGKKPEQDVEYLQIIDRNGRHLLSLINDILDLSKIEAGRMDRFFTEFRPQDVLDRVLEIASPLAEAKDLRIKVQTDDVPTIRSDEEKLRQILLNLVSNAVKFTDNGEIEVSLATSDSHVSFVVRDTGLGIDDTQLEHVFDEFRQVDGSTTRAHEGTGLGLAIGRKLARLLGGEITVESEVGAGSTFVLTLPLKPNGDGPNGNGPNGNSPNGNDKKQTDDQTAGKTVAAPAAKSESSRADAAPHRTILVIDDDPEACDLLRSFLEEAGYEVVISHDGAQGVRVARQVHPHVILLDVLMPRIDGWETLRELKASQLTANIPVLIVSVSDDLATGMALEAAAYLNKPVDKDALLGEIKRIVAVREAKSVLVVEDNDVAALQIRSALEESGYQVTVATGGAEAIRCVERSIPGAIVLDLMMPEVDGFAVLEQIRSIDWLADVPVLVLTAKELTTKDRSRLKSNNVSQLLQKGSINRTQLVAYVSKLFEKTATAVPASPAQSKTAESKPVKQASTRLPTTSSEKTILIVEDHADNRFTLAQLLDDMGYRHVMAEDGWQAIAAAKEHQPDLILMDLQLPGLGGLDAAKQIKADAATEAIPIVAVTAKAMKGDREAILAGGCDGYLPKPIDRADLLELLCRQLK